MIDKLSSLKKITTIVADTGDIDEIEIYKPQDATTNPSLILKAAKLNKYNKIIHKSINWAKKNSNKKEKQIKLAADKIIVNIGLEILKKIPGKVSTEIDARLSYNTIESINKAKFLIDLYEKSGINKNFVLIKMASTWQGIKAAEELEKDGIKCNLTLLFSFAQAKACAESKVFLISPFIGRIFDWYSLNKQQNYDIKNDPGVIAVSKIYKYYKKYNYKTLIMGASFRNVDEILQLAGCDMLTISPVFLKKLSDMTGEVKRKLIFNDLKKTYNMPKKMTESEFLWHHNQNEMAVTKLSEGIRNFAIDQEKLEKMIYHLL